MTTNFNILFTLEISHDYYSSVCEDFTFVVPARTAQMLRNRKLIARVVDARLYVLFEADENGDALLDATGETVRFGLKLRNPLFCNFTELAFAPGSVAALYRNSESATGLDALEQVTVVGNVFSHELTNAERPVTTTLSNAAGETVSTEVITAENDRSTVTFDLTGFPAGRYSIAETYSGDEITAAYYLDWELQREGVFGVVEIVVDGGFYSSAPAFSVPFDAREETLSYYVVTHNYSGADLTVFSVTDNSGEASAIEFDRVLGTSFTSAEIDPSFLGSTAAEVVLFKSTTEVARRENARKKIQLNRNGTVLVQHLPQPGADRTAADMIIHVSKPEPT